MNPSERNEQKDQATAWLVTIIVHVAVVAALFFVAFPHPKNTDVSPNKNKIENQSSLSNSKIKPKA